MRRILLRVAYDGTAYHGWQLQGEQPTIELELNRALQLITGEEIFVAGASRTDAGVHAKGNLAIFDTEARMPAEKFSYALNTRLPEDIRVWFSGEVEPDFHPRTARTEKTYCYRIYCAPFPDPTRRLYSHFTYHTLDVMRMDEAVRFLVGEHDFKSFCSVYSQALTTVREITGASVSSEDVAAGKEIRITVRGYGFLYNMVRIIAGTLMEVGSGKFPPEEMQEILEARDRRAAGPTAPARGLTLEEIRIL